MAWPLGVRWLSNSANEICAGVNYLRLCGRAQLHSPSQRFYINHCENNQSKSNTSDIPRSLKTMSEICQAFYQSDPDISGLGVRPFLSWLTNRFAFRYSSRQAWCISCGG